MVVRLALARGRGVPDELLADDIWGRGEVPDPPQRLRVLIYRLRRSLGRHAHVIHRSATGYALTATVSDLQAMEQALADREYTAALAHWAGPALADLRNTPFGATEGSRLDSLRLDLQVKWLSSALDNGDPVEHELEKLVTANPLHEELVGLSAIALYRAGRQADALARLGDLRTSLADELGVDPSPATAELEIRLLRQDPALIRRHTVQLPALRWPASTFVGRDRERAALLGQLAGSTVVTLTGGPGAGKTRLAQEVAAIVQDSGRPVAWLDLAPVTDGVRTRLASAIGVDAGPSDPLPRCIEAVAGALLVIDNAEHLVDTVAPMVSEIQLRAAGATVLVTSQRALRISGEKIVQVGPLSRTAANALFRARSRLGPDDRIDAICSALDRVPLAVELAAGLTRTLTLAQLAERTDHQLKLLVGGNRDSHGRHSSLRDAIDWSYSLLDPPARSLLERIAVFAGGCTLEAAEQVAAGAGLEVADVPPILADLHDRCLVAVDSRHETPRFVLLQAVRDYAREKLTASGEEFAVRRRHAQWCAELAVRTAKYGGPDHNELLAELVSEEANLTAAIEWALTDQPDLVLGMVAPTWWYWWVRGLMTKGREWLGRALDNTDDSPTAERAAALRAIASLTRNSGDAAQARELGLRALRIFERLEDQRGQTSTLIGLAITNISLDDHETARQQAEQAAERARLAGDTRVRGAAVNVVGGALRCLGRTDEAAAKFDEACELWRSVDDRRGLAGTLGNLGLVAMRTGELARARELCMEALRLYRDLDLVEGLLDIEELIGGLEVAEGRPAAALRLFTVTAARRQQIGAPLIVPDELAARDEAEAAARRLAVEPARSSATAESLADDLLAGRAIA